MEFLLVVLLRFVFVRSFNTSRDLDSQTKIVGRIPIYMCVLYGVKLTLCNFSRPFSHLGNTPGLS